MKLISDEVRILIDRMRQRPEDFEGLNKNKKWLDTFDRVKAVSTLCEWFLMKRAAKQVIRDNALRSVVDAVAGWDDKEEEPQYKHSSYSSISTGNIMNQAALNQAALRNIAIQGYNNQQSLMNAGMYPYGGATLGDPRVPPGGLDLGVSSTDLFGKAET